MRNILQIYFFVAFYCLTFGQGLYNNIYKDNINEHFNITSPSAGEFERVTSTNINEAFGTANIKIPLFEIKEGNISVPIYLSYNSQGIKVNQVESNVGLGWSISSFFISREIRDAHDLDDYQYGTILNNRVGYFKKKKKNINYDFVNIGQRRLSIDMVPDIYNAYLANGKNTFFFEDESDYKLLSRSSIIVNPKKDSLLSYVDYKIKDFYSFDIKDENGLEYNFSDYNVASSYVGERDLSTQPPTPAYAYVPYVSNWFVSKITDKLNNKKVEFEYVEGKSFGRNTSYISRDIFSGFYSKAYIGALVFGIRKGYYYDKLFPDEDASNYNGALLTKGFISSTFHKMNPNGLQNAPQSHSYYDVFNEKIYQKNLSVKKISFSGGYILYDYDNDKSNFDENIITSIQLYDKNDNLIKKFNFHYDRFACQNSSPNFGNCTERLKLTSVEEVGKGEYKFVYDETHPLPNITSKSFDYGGFFNGSIGSDNTTNMQDNIYYYPDSKEWSLLPFDINSNGTNKHVINFGNLPYYSPYSRLPNIEYATTGILKSIEYPTGGKQEYVYELNDFVIKNSTQLGSGLRVKSTTLKDENNTVQDVTTYNYINDDNTSSGEMIYPPFIGYPLAQLFESYFDEDYQAIVSHYNGLPNFQSNHYDMLFKVYDMPSEAPIRYKRVEKVRNGSGKEIIEFIDKGLTTFANSKYMPFPNINVSNVETQHNFSEFLYTNSAYGLRYNNYFDLSQLSNERKRIYKNENGNIVREEKTDYQLLAPRYDNFSAGSNFIKPIITYHNAQYSYEYFPYPDKFVTQGSIYFVNSYSILVPYEKEVNSFFTTGSSKTDVLKIRYALNRHSMPMTHSYNIEADGYVNGTANLFFDNLSSTILNLNLKNKVIGSYSFNGYDVLDEFDRPYGYKNRMRSEYNSDSYTSNLFKPKRIITDLGQGESIDAIFDRYDNKGNLLQSTKGGISTTYIYGYNQNYPIATISGATYDQVMTAFGKDPNDNQAYLQLDIVKKSILDKDLDTEKALIKGLDLFRSNPGLSNYQVTTYTYDPLIGITSITPTNGIRQNYKYDSANRLIEIKDINGRILQENKYNYKQ
ncbi:hypothetical protein [Epilithonimonas sp.]|uniref:hypothetical protein n=1 Tax=Epilithonimonas sp. TaxID=2894511 RepID=UPI00289E95F3|nr:hypothetical protein [Epilithonimonas sp.]